MILSLSGFSGFWRTKIMFKRLLVQIFFSDLSQPFQSWNPYFPLLSVVSLKSLTPRKTACINQWMPRILGNWPITGHNMITWHGLTNQKLGFEWQSWQTVANDIVCCQCCLTYHWEFRKGVDLAQLLFY